ncbi:unnamed protein product [Euphydryas editha]|uniref:Uncharacterized protein n=1 Tax=Euphydryas editha TaxID=104508 RepID=A0AAU9TJY5_EUPED|nr:unnamed protein product [Euphydryas editha]
MTIIRQTVARQIRDILEDIFSSHSYWSFGPGVVSIKVYYIVTSTGAGLITIGRSERDIGPKISSHVCCAPFDFSALGVEGVDHELELIGISY